jgi:hypothetical protein
MTCIEKEFTEKMLQGEQEKLPETLTELNCRDHVFTYLDLDHLPETMTELDCSNHVLTHLDDLTPEMAGLISSGAPQYYYELSTKLTEGANASERLLPIIK